MLVSSSQGHHEATWIWGCAGDSVGLRRHAHQ